MKNLSKINFFICSTVLDLKDHREAVIKKIQANKGIINAQEFFGAQNRKPLQTCLQEVEGSNVVIIILGNRYGSISGNSDKSFVEHEYDKATELGRVRLAYIIDEEYPVPPKHVDKGEGAEKLAVLKERVKKDLTVEFFTNPEDLAEKVFRDLLKTLPSEGFTINREEAKKTEKKTLSHDLFKFVSLPKLNYGLEFEVKAKLGRVEPASINECKALSLTHGATIKRHYEILENVELESLLVKIGKHIFASYDVAQALIDLPNDSTVTQCRVLSKRDCQSMGTRS